LNPSNIPLLPNQNSFEPIGESSCNKNPPSTHVLDPTSFSTPSIYRILKESYEDEPSKENTEEVEQQVNQEAPSKAQHNQEVEEGETLLKYPRNLGRKIK
jgi:hypothetical protein